MKKILSWFLSILKKCINMKKRILAVLLSLLMVETALPVSMVQAAEGEVPIATFMLSNESGSENEGGLVDKLIAAGYRNNSLYEVMHILKPISGGAITDEFMAALTACPADSDVKTAQLYNFSDVSNNPIGIGADGSLIVASFYGRNYNSNTNFTTTVYNHATIGNACFTSAKNEAFYLDAGSNTDAGITHYYNVFAIAWSPVKVTGSATDNSVTMSLGNVTVSTDNTWEMNLATGTLKGSSGDNLTSDITVSGLPSGLTYAAENGGENNIIITVSGTAASQITDETTVSVVIKGSAVSDIAAADSDIISVKLYPSALVGDATTFVLSNEEGGLIDDLIAAGYGNSNLFETLYALQDSSGGVISDAFIETLALCPAGSEIFTAKLSNFAGLNNPVCINSDGTLGIQPIFGRVYYGMTGYVTYPEHPSTGSQLFTYATSPQYYMDSGESLGLGTTTTRYMAFAIAWSPAQVTGVCRIGATQYTTLDSALTAVKDGETITLLQNIDYNSGISISNKHIIFDLNGYTLNVANTNGSGLEVGSGGSVSTSGTGQLNITGSTYGVYAHDGGLAIVTSAGSTESASTGVKAASGGKITITGNINGMGGAFASGAESNITVNGSITASDSNGSGAWAASGGKIVIGGSVQGGIYGIHAVGSNSSIQVGGNVTATSAGCTGAYAESGANLNITGNVTGITYGVIALGSTVFIGGTVSSGAYGVVARSGGEITIDGVITVGAGSRIAIGSGTCDLITPTTKIGYTTYSDGESTVWVKDTISTLKIAGTAMDATTILKIDKQELSLDNSWKINVTSGTVKGLEGGDLTESIILNGLPDGLTYIATKSGTNCICITLSGEANTELIADTVVSAVIKGNAVTEVGAQDSESLSLDLWYIGSGTTFVITNEGGLIDKLISAGYGDYCLYDVLEVLQPQSDGVISDRFLKILKSCPADSDIFDDKALLHNFAELNNPICINLDGTMSINPIFAKDLFDREGYITKYGTQIGVGQELFTYATTDAYFVHAGEREVTDTTRYYNAFAIAWSANLPTVITNVVGTNDVTIVTANLSGSVTTDNVLPITERGFVYCTTVNPTTSTGTKLMAGSGIGAFTASISGLTAGTTYHVRAYACSNAGIAYGEDRSFTTNAISNSVVSADNQNSDNNIVPDTPVSLPDEQVPLGSILFTDIAGHWAEDEIYDLVRKGIIKGYDDDTFRPDRTITRAEFADMLVKAFNLEPKNDKTFDDITGHWAQDAIETAASYGIIKGYNESTFGPDDVIQREQMAAMVTRAMKKNAATEAGSIFIDADTISGWAKQDVDAVVEELWMIGYLDNTFRPHGNTTRAEAVRVIYNILKKS